MAAVVLARTLLANAHSTLSTSASFRTVINVPPAPFSLGPDSRALFLGSCFAENIGERLRRASLAALVNPSHGIVYNPLSLAAALERIASAAPYGPADLQPCAHDPSRLVSFAHHSRFGGRAGVDTELARMNRALEHAHAHLRTSDVLFLTLGTSWAFARDGAVVANCHKQPAAAFERVFIGADNAAAALARAVAAARSVSPRLRVVVTVSPVRHWKDGAVDNSLSKATLLVAAHQLVRTLGKEAASYFPAYELLMDDLRDYRFYANDMLHPSGPAIDYIWRAFTAAYLALDAAERIAAVEAVRTAAAHRPMDGDSAAVRQFGAAQFRKADEIERRWGLHAGRALAGEREHFARLRDGEPLRWADADADAEEQPESGPR
ncbi:hypothetical protein KFE25_013329 [Diacronema lutheri]|uniref:GSCFA domain-containing protein n=1 Tax=Diacronema lutheri TaxID=2081491 RepID=A0A7R9UMQ3_DIALT|nr:hypothetical protein KFE25_013329 [Diacronema lutheri]|mmetsp:Transcript_15244/g.47549  ORF Transcript_15244/g.47549 Transcript_15244/m.47549 type:complete len:379 (+) Transcript_15244:939-2075(+)